MCVLDAENRQGNNIYIYIYIFSVSDIWFGQIIISISKYGKKTNAGALRHKRKSRDGGKIIINGGFAAIIYFCYPKGENAWRKKNVLIKPITLSLSPWWSWPAELMGGFGACQVGGFDDKIHKKQFISLGICFFVVLDVKNGVFAICYVIMKIMDVCCASTIILFIHFMMLIHSIGFYLDLITCKYDAFFCSFFL